MYHCVPSTINGLNQNILAQVVTHDDHHDHGKHQVRRKRGQELRYRCSASASRGRCPIQTPIGTQITVPRR